MVHTLGDRDNRATHAMGRHNKLAGILGVLPKTLGALLAPDPRQLGILNPMAKKLAKKTATLLDELQLSMARGALGVFVAYQEAIVQPTKLSVRKMPYSTELNAIMKRRALELRGSPVKECPAEQSKQVHFDLRKNRLIPCKTGAGSN